MWQGLRQLTARAWLVALTVCVISLAACRQRGTPDSPAEDILRSGEPETYSATVVHILDDGTPHEASVSRVVRSGDLLRQEWDEQGESRAMIWRPDLGKCFLLSPNRKEFVEMTLGPQTANAASAAALAPAGSQPNEANASRDSAPSPTPDAIDRAMSDAQEPASVETHVLPDLIIDNHPCQVVEQRARFADGHLETTRTARARDLGGLALRIEIVPDTQSGSVKIITERRAIRTAVSPDEFNVPADFRHIGKLGSEK